MEVKYLVCLKCKKKKSINYFYLKNNIPYGACKECTKEKNKKWRDQNREKYLIAKKNWKINNKEKNSKLLKLWRDNNKDKIKKTNADYYLNNTKKFHKTNAKYSKQRRLNDPLFKLICNIRSLIYHAFKNNKIQKNTRTSNILGCTFEEFKLHIEKQFDNKMNWNNHGSYWEYDHIKPISLAKTEQEVYELNHYTNFQPLEKTQNRLKGNKYGS